MAAVSVHPAHSNNIKGVGRCAYVGPVGVALIPGGVAYYNALTHCNISSAGSYRGNTVEAAESVIHFFIVKLGIAQRRIGYVNPCTIGKLNPGNPVSFFYRVLAV